jgi:hypothetical protein
MELELFALVSAGKTEPCALETFTTTTEQHNQNDRAANDQYQPSSPSINTRLAGRWLAHLSLEFVWTIRPADQSFDIAVCVVEQ